MHVHTKNVAGGGLLLTTLLAITTLATGSSANAAEPNIPKLAATTISASRVNLSQDTVEATVALDSGGIAWVMGAAPKTNVVYFTGQQTAQVSIGSNSIASLSKSGQMQAVLNISNIEYGAVACNQDSNSQSLPKIQYAQVYTSGTAAYGIDTNGILYRCIAAKSEITTMKVALPPVQSIDGEVEPIAVTKDGKVYTWLDDDIGEPYQTVKPEQVKFPDGITIRQATRYGNSLYVALDSTGQAWTWGNNKNGQLGTGTTDNYSTPTKEKQPAGVQFTNVVASQYGMAAIDMTGQAWTWGSPSGNGSGQSSTVPVKVLNPTGIHFTEITAGNSYYAARDTDGNVWTWGGGPVGNGQAKIDPTRPLRAFDFNSDSSEKPSGGTTVISCAPTTGVVPTGLSVFGMVAAGLGLLGVLVVWLRRRLV